MTAVVCYRYSAGLALPTAGTLLRLMYTTTAVVALTEVGNCTSFRPVMASWLASLVNVESPLSIPSCFEIWEPIQQYHMYLYLVSLLWGLNYWRCLLYIIYIMYLLLLYRISTRNISAACGITCGITYFVLLYTAVLVHIARPRENVADSPPHLTPAYSIL